MLIVTHVEKDVVHIHTRRLEDHRGVADVWTDGPGAACVVGTMREVGQILTAHGVFDVGPYVDRAVSALEQS